MPKIYLYAEVLTHLRQLTLHASLETEKNEETKIEISSDKKIITVIHDGESSSLYLPTQISGTAQVTFPYEKKTEISARVQIEDIEQWKEMDADGIEAPWNASELSFETSVKCIRCDSEILPMGSISTWKDLPNQNWADVMDMWFCHKPQEHLDGQQEEKAAEAKGFSAQSRLASEPGTGFVDLMSLTTHPDDCNNLKLSKAGNENVLKPVPTYCEKCHSLIGTFSPNDNLVRLHKSSIEVKATRKDSFISYPPSTFISAELLELVESTAIRKFLVYCLPPGSTSTGNEEASPSPSTHNHIDLAVRPKPEQGSSEERHGPKKEDGEPSSKCSETPSTTASVVSQTQPDTQPLLLWIFNPDIYYSSSRLTTQRTPMTSNQSPTISPKQSATEPPRKNQPNTSTSSPRPPPPPTDHPPNPFKTSITLPHRAIKIFYRPLTTTEITTHLPPPCHPPLSSSSSPPPPAPPTTPSQSSPSSSLPTTQQHEHLPLPTPETLTSLTQTLHASTAMLPATARTFQDYTVGLLDRYERHPTAEKVMENNPLAKRLQGHGHGDDDDDDIAADGLPRVTRWEMPAGAHELYL